MGDGGCEMGDVKRENGRWEKWFPRFLVHSSSSLLVYSSSCFLVHYLW